MIKTLYRQEKLAVIEETELKYIPLSIAQSGIIYEILILGTQDSVSTPEERAKLPKSKLLELCVGRFVSVQQECQNTKSPSLELQLISQMLLEPEVNNLLHKLIGEVFPQIKTPHLLTNSSMMMLFAFLIQEFSESIGLK